MSVYVAAGVPLELFGEVLEPPQQHSSTSDGTRKRQSRRDLFGPTLPGSKTYPIKAKAHSQGELAKPDGCNPAVGGVVVTLTLNVEASVALTNAVSGTEQSAPLGAPPQLNEAVPPVPAPPIERL